MKSLLALMLFISFGITTISEATMKEVEIANEATSKITFFEELSDLRKKMIPMCAKLKMKDKTDQSKLFKEIDSIIENWKTITKKYQKNPPLQFIKDSDWNTYFDEALDNFIIMRERVAQNNLNRAVQFCGMNCNLFVNMNHINGINKISDQLFVVRKNVRVIMKMINAENWKGALELQTVNRKFVKNMMNSKSGHFDKKKLSEDLKTIKITYDEFISMAKKKDKSGANDKFLKFMKTFSSVYPKYL